MKQSTTPATAGVARLPWRGKRPFYGWIVVSAGVVTQFFQGITNQGFSTYLPALQDQFGWSRAVLAAPRAVTQVENSVLGPIEGYLVDRIGPRWMATIGVTVMGLGLVLFGLTNNLLMYYVSNVVIAFGTGFQGLLVMSVAVNNWFRRRRTIAQATMLLGFSMAGLVGVPAIVMLQNVVGWQASAIWSGVFIWVTGLPCTMLLRTKPEPYGLLPDGVTPGAEIASGGAGRQQYHAEYDFSLREALRTRAFWMLAVGWAIGNLGMGAGQTHLYLHLEKGEPGLTHATAAIVWSVASGVNIPFRLIGGFLGDRIPKNVLLGLATLSMAAATYVLAIATSANMAFLYAVLYGIGWGIRTPVMNAMQADYFGRKSLGKIVGWLQSLSLPITIAAPVLIGYMADVQGTYRWAFLITALVSLPGAVLIFLATQPRQQQAARNSQT
jgi:MFS family permease